MDKFSAEPSLAFFDDMTRAPLELPLPPSQPGQHSVEKEFHSSSLPYLGDFMAKLLHDAYKLQSLNIEFERTKQLLGEAEEKLASLEEPKSSLKTQLNRTKQQLRKAEAKTAATEKALRIEQEKNEQLKAHNTFLLHKWAANLTDGMFMLDHGDEAMNKLRTLESHANDLEVELKRKNDVLEQKDEAFQSKIHNYRAILHRLNGRHSDMDPVIDGIARHIKSLMFPNIEMQHILQKLETVKIDIKEDIDELCREVEWDLCQTKT